MRNGTVWACVNRIALSLAMLKPSAYKGPQVGSGQAKRLAAPRMLSSPSSDALMFAFTYSAWVSLLLRGNVYGLILERDSKLAYPTQVELQHPDQMRVKKLNDGTYEYRLRNKLLDPDKVWHRAINRMPGSRVGMSAIQYAANTIMTSQMAERFGLQWFEDGAHPSAILTNSEAKMIDQKDSAAIKQRFLAAVTGREPVVLSGGWDYKPVQIAPNESQFLETLKFSSGDICKFFLMQPEMVGSASEGSAITYANVEQRGMDYLTHTISPRMIEWEEWLGEDFLPHGQYVKCDTSPLLRTSMLERWKAYHMMIGSRALTQDEVRAFEDMPPLTPEQQAAIDKMPMPPPIAAPAAGS